MVISLQTFHGEIPAVAARLLKSGYAQRAINCKLLNGNLQPYRTLLQTIAAQVTNPLTIFLYRSTHWLQFATDVNIIRAPISGDTVDTLIYSGDGAPKITNASLATSGLGPYPTTAYLLGVPAPVNAIIASLAGTATPNGTVEYRNYVYTYVNSFGQEGPPSPVSNTVQWQAGQAVTVANMSGAPAGAYNMTAKRIYRTNAGDASAEFQFVAEIGIGTATVNDTTLSENLGEVLVTTTYNPPPAGLKGLVALPNGGAAGFLANEVFLCEPYSCQAWPYIYATHDPIVGLGAYGNSLLILTTGNPYVLTGDHPSSMSMERLEVSFPCLSKRGIVDLGYAIAFPSPAGLIVIGVGMARNVTAPGEGGPGILTDEQWLAFNPASMIGVEWQGKYVGFYNNGTAGAFIIDPQINTITHLTSTATGAWSDPLTGKLYLVNGQNIVQFNAGSTYLPSTWKSGIFVAPRPINMSAAQVLAKSYPLTFTLHCSALDPTEAMSIVMNNPLLTYEEPGGIAYTVTVTNSKPFRLPGGYVGREYSVQIETTLGVEIESIFVANILAELGSV